MGSSSSIEKVYQLPNEEKSNKKRLSRTDIQIVRKSWKEMGNFKTNGLNMMIKLVFYLNFNRGIYFNDFLILMTFFMISWKKKVDLNFFKYFHFDIYESFLIDFIDYQGVINKVLPAI